MSVDKKREHAEKADERVTPTAAAADIPAWEVIDTGRYMPRRFRGSFRGRELG